MWKILTPGCELKFLHVTGEGRTALPEECVTPETAGDRLVLGVCKREPQRQVAPHDLELEC